MKKLLSFFLVISTMACANQAFNQPAVKSNITGFYMYTSMFLSATTYTGLQLNADGSGFHCFYSNSQPQPKKTPIKHIGDDVWAAASFGTGKIVKNGDGSIKWGPTKYLPVDISNTSCK